MADDACLFCGVTVETALTRIPGGELVREGNGYYISRCCCSGESVCFDCLDKHSAREVLGKMVGV